MKNNIEKKINELVDGLSGIFNDRLKSVILYGEDSAANLMVILDQLHAGDLKSAFPVIKKWNSAKKALPVFMDEDEWQSSTDIYPMEYLGIKNKHKILCGHDLVSSIHVEKCHLRLQCEYELKSLLINIREMYLSCSNNPKFMEKIIKNSSNKIVRILRSILHLFDQELLEDKEEIIEAVSNKINIDKNVFLEIFEIAENKKKLSKQEMEGTIQRIIDSFNELLKYVDNMEEICN